MTTAKIFRKGFDYILNFQLQKSSYVFWIEFIGYFLSCPKKYIIFQINSPYLTVTSINRPSPLSLPKSCSEFWTTAIGS